ncbi:MAG: tRNA epoxyqueuosine(34) reductase QueG [Bacteroidia bacterium]|nr:tRNA epoxyqueuosine(34) reductase QueG [Bacteroidia bacterium]
MDKSAITLLIKEEAQRLGFALTGISKAEFLEEEARDLETWLQEGRHGTMEWMAQHFDKRTDPRLLVEGAKSVISVLHNYFPDPSHQLPADAPKISTYAWGEDYHAVLKRKLYALLEFIQVKVGAVSARVFTDSAPVMDKAWARRSGLGWIGKNTNLIHPKMGSWFFIGEIILDLELEADGPIKDYCGTCTKCLEACPTDALTPYQIDSNKCISYLTIELKENIPAEYRQKLDGWAYGCDICQEVCPWNSFSQVHHGQEFKPLDHILEYNRKDWTELSKSRFSKLTRPSAMSRIRFEKWLDNLDASREES